MPRRPRKTGGRRAAPNPWGEMMRGQGGASREGEDDPRTEAPCKVPRGSTQDAQWENTLLMKVNRSACPPLCQTHFVFFHVILSATLGGFANEETGAQEVMACGQAHTTCKW
jgi:hypothetical protein